MSRFGRTGSVLRCLKLSDFIGHIMCNVIELPKGTVIVPLMPGEKRPLEGRRVEDIQTDDPSEIKRLRERGFGLGLRLYESNLSAWGIDDKDQARLWWAAHCKEGILQCASETKRGIHVLFGGHTRTRRFEHGDVKGNGHIVIPDTVIDDWHYRWIYALKTLDLPPFPEHLFPEKHEEPKKAAIEMDSFRRIIRAKAYGVKVKCIYRNEPSKTLFRFVCWMKALGLSPTEVFAVLLDWNKTNCFREDGVTPYPWSERELKHKIDDVFKL